MTGPVHVLLFAAASEPAINEAYHRISQRLSGVPGLLRNKLLRQVDRPGSFAILSEWASLTAFRAWEDGPDHRSATAPMRPLQDRSLSSAFGVYCVAAQYPPEAVSADDPVL